MKTLLTGNRIISPKPINGRANIRDYPWDYTHSPNGTASKDLNGLDTIYVQDGVNLIGDRPLGRDIDVTQVAGTGIVLAGTTISYLQFSHVHSAIYGVRVDATDAKLREVDLDNIVKDALTVNGGGNTFIDGSHVSGADRAFVFNSRIIGTGLFPDNARVGMLFDNDSHGSTVTGLPIRGCWDTSIDLQANGVSIWGLSGVVSDGKHPGAIGVNFNPNALHESINGWCFVPEDCTGLVVQGQRHNIKLIGGGWNVPQERSVYLKLKGLVQDTDIDIVGYGDGGTVVDATEAKLVNVNIKTRWGSSTPDASAVLLKQ